MRAIIIYIQLVLFALVFSGRVMAGDTISGERKPYVKSIHFYYQPGTVIQTHAYVKGDNPYNRPYGFYHSSTVQYGIQTDGRKLWQQLYGYPVWGFGAYGAVFPGDDQLGFPLALYTYFNAPFKRWKKWSINYEVDMGVSFNWKSHDLLENGYYYPIGSYATVFFDFGINSVVRLTRRLDLFTGIDFVHFSNGAVKLPNLGINMFSVRMGVRYLPGERPDFIRQERPHYQKEWEWLLTISPSVKQVAFTYVDAGSDTTATAYNYGIVTLSSAINRQLSDKMKIGGGIDLSYNGAYGADTIMVNGMPDKAPSSFSSQFLVGVFPSFELVINRISMILQPGYYVYKPKTDSDDVPTTYQRVGLRYYLVNDIVAGVNIRAYNFSKADFIEFNFGYALKWKKSYRNP